MSKAVQTCKNCTSEKDCPDDTQGCSSLGVCGTCAAKVGEEGIAACRPTSAITKPERNVQKRCSSTADCKGGGCDCNADLKLCVDQGIAKAKSAACPTCATDADCPGSTCHESKKCQRCWLPAALDGIKACHDVGTAEDVPEPSNSRANNSNIPQSNSNSHQDLAPCISTSWLRERGLEHAAIHHGGTANVLCVPGLPELPCGTPGHLLREYASGSGGCNLVTYREVCARRRGCIKSATAVSQLSHAFDWSQFKAAGALEGSTVQLTSLSAHPLSSPSSPSRFVAYLADRLNSAGLGALCNAVALSPHRVHVIHGAELAREAS